MDRSNQMHDAEVRAAFQRMRSRDEALFNRALGILHRMATENVGWRSVWSRWYYADEPLRNDAANLVREAGFGMMQPINTRLVGDPISSEERRKP